jgi:hypothetical protein
MSAKRSPAAENPLDGEPNLNATIYAISYCSPFGQPMIPGHIVKRG